MSVKSELYGNTCRFVEQYRRGDIDYKALWYKVNFNIISRSHDVTARRGVRGHRIRQKIRRSMWYRVKKAYPELRKYKLPSDINGHSNPNIGFFGWIKTILRR
jgi:hypothetical protein